MIDRYVVFDLETNSDRAEVAEHEIIEIGAIAFEGNSSEEFSTLVQHERPLTPTVQKLTGLGPRDFADASPLGEVLDAFKEFVADAPLIAHNGLGYDYPVLDASCDRAGVPAPGDTRLDSLELAHLVFPRAGALATDDADGATPPPGRHLDDLATACGIEVGTRHRAMDDARLLAGVFLALVDALETEEPDRQLQRWVLHQGEHPWSRFLSEPPRPPLEEVIASPDPWEPAEPNGVFDPRSAVEPLDERGALIADTREFRPAQVEMARAVTGALAQSEHLLIEAPTGTGKTFGYLVPAIAWARATGRAVAIATHSKVLQNQVLSAIPEVEAELGPVRSTLLKGRENYISLDALDGALDGVTEGDALALAVIVGWVARTKTGEWDDLRTWAIEREEVTFPRLRWCLRIDTAPGPPRERLDELCFYRRALDRVGTSDLVVINHAVLVSRTDLTTPLEYLVLDEAHNIEDTATAALSETTSSEEVHRILDAIWDPGSRWGTVGRFQKATRTPAADPVVTKIKTAVGDARSSADRVSEVLVRYVREKAGARREEVQKYGASYRLRRGLDTRDPAFQSVLGATAALRDALRAIADALNDLEVPKKVRRPYRRYRLEAEIGRVGRTARQAATLIAEIPWCDGDDVWIHIADLSIESEEWHWQLRRVPLSVAPALRELWDRLESAISTSATLRVAQEWGHIVSRLGLDSARTVAVGNPFPEISNQHLLVLPDHLPTPRGGLMDEFAYAEADEIARLATLSGGRAMALFTARARLEFSREQVRPVLAERQLTLLAQGDAPAPALVERMRTEREVSLLATRSFWEGVDVPGEALSLLVIEKLPFDPPSDPVVQARTELLELRGRDPFAEYIVPSAALRLVQGMGRLIRTKDDIGATVILDKRLRKPLPYRETFLRSLPGPPRTLRPVGAEEGYRAIAEHLPGIDLDNELLEAIRSIPASDPWRLIDELALSEEELKDSGLVRERLEEVRTKLGFSHWRPGQLEVMERIITGEDVIAVLPTGSGKSLTFQIPALLLPGVTLVVSPLVALMRDQVEQLRDRGLTRVAAVHSGISQGEQEEVLSGARSGRYKLLYVSPERLWSKRFRSALRKLGISRVAVDEAHCISQWGHSFRPEYAAIPGALESLLDKGRPPIAALTATATDGVRTEIADLLTLESEETVIMSPNRPELHYWVEKCENRNDRDLRVVQVLQAFRGQSVIVYVPRRDDALRIAGLVQAAGSSARGYHGALDTAQRTNIEEEFRYGEIDVVVATKAFGLGIDKPDIAAVVHLEMPASVEEYIQETGRAARGALTGDGPVTGHCILLSTPRDCGIHRMFVKSAAPKLEDVKAVWDVLDSDAEILLPPDELAERAGLESSAARGEGLALAVHHLILDGAVERHEDIMWSGRVWIPSDVSDLLADFARQDERRAKEAGLFIDRVARLGSEEFDAAGWSRRLDMDASDVEERLLDLNRRDIIGLSAWRFAWHLSRVPGIEPDWGRIESRCGERKDLVKDLSKEAKRYSRQKSQCRRAWLMEYLGAEELPPCDSCDVCRPDLERPWAEFVVSEDSMAEALPSRQTAISLLLDVDGRGFSEESLARAVAGAIGPSTGEALKAHYLYGRLSQLGLDRCREVLDDLVADGLATYEERTVNDHTYRTITLTSEGRRWK